MTAPDSNISVWTRTGRVLVLALVALFLQAALLLLLPLRAVHAHHVLVSHSTVRYTPVHRDATNFPMHSVTKE